MVRLVRANLELMDAALAGDDELARALGVEAVHTLPERNASNRVLENAGFRFDGWAEEEEEGESVWRFRRARVDGEPIPP